MGFPRAPSPLKTVHPACFCSQEGPEASLAAQHEFWGRGCAQWGATAPIAHGQLGAECALGWPLSTKPLLGCGFVLGSLDAHG